MNAYIFQGGPGDKGDKGSPGTVGSVGLKGERVKQSIDWGNKFFDIIRFIHRAMLVNQGNEEK